MEHLSGRRKWTKDDDLPLVHGCDVRSNCDSAENECMNEENELIEDDETSEFLQPEYSNEAEKIALRLFWRRFLEFYMKFVLLILSTICAGFHGQWASHVTKNFITVFPFSAFCGFSAMMVYVILIYRWWHRTSKYVRMAAMLVSGAIFLAVGVMELYYLNNHSFTSDGFMYEIEYTNENKTMRNIYKHVSEGTITSVTAMSFTIGALCSIDALVLIT